MLPLPQRSPYDGKVALIARVLPCKLEKSTDVRGFASFTQMTSAPEVMDLQSLRAVVGRVVDHRKSYVSDRSRFAIPASLASDVVDS